MAYDGFVAAATVKELNDRLLDGSISKIAQPEKDELLLTVKANRNQYRLFLSANASMPMVYLSERQAVSPLTAPGFCMALRKHLSGGHIREIYQAGDNITGKGLERVIVFVIQHLDEMGDLSEKLLVCELMGRHSNIILLGKDLKVIDSIKRISSGVSSVREVLPGREYFIPSQEGKNDPFLLSRDEAHFMELLKSSVKQLSGFFPSVCTGFSNAVSYELCFRAGLDPEAAAETLGDAERSRLFASFRELMQKTEAGDFSPNIVYEGDRAKDISAIPLHSLEGGAFRARSFEGMSEAVESYYREKALELRVRAKSEDMRHLLKGLTERTARKLELQEKQYADAEKRDKYRLWGELLQAFGHQQDKGSKELKCTNYYDGQEISIPLDPELTPLENSVRYFDRYGKLKRTAEALKDQIEKGRQTLYHLDSLQQALELCENEADIAAIRSEMSESGYVKSGAPGKGKNQKKAEKPSEPMHFVSSDGLDIYVGRNNEQNEYLSFKLASPEDYFFHAKNAPGSHVILRTGGKPLPDASCLEAAALAAWYSRPGRDHPGARVEVDYVPRKELRKVNGAPKGFVIYHTNHSLTIEGKPSI